MSKKVLGLSLAGLLITGTLCAIPPQKGHKAIFADSGHRLTENVAQPVIDGDVPHTSLQRRNPRYQLSEGDVLDLNFPFTPGFNQTVTVLPDGYIGLRGIGSLHVEGDTVPKLRQALQQVYSRILNDPVITVALKDFRKPYFIVGGQVQHPGKFDLRGDTTVMQAIEIAGGFNDDAKHSHILLYRKVSNGWVEVKKLDLRNMLHGKNLNEDPHLSPGDMLFVPKSTFSKFKQFIPSTGMGLYYNPAY